MSVQYLSNVSGEKQLLMFVVVKNIIQDLLPTRARAAYFTHGFIRVVSLKCSQNLLLYNLQCAESSFFSKDIIICHVVRLEVLAKVEVR